MKSAIAALLSLLLLAHACVAQKAVVRKADLAEASDAEMLNKVQGQLLNALELLQVYQEEQQPLVGVAPNQLKFTEKRRNKFEFIRFGRR